ncbi:MAG: hypothetical protein WC842_04120 [Candidatus Paceibacterota bacterium]|jgi:hypothetical protein
MDKKKIIFGAGVVALLVLISFGSGMFTKKEEEKKPEGKTEEPMFVDKIKEQFKLIPICPENLSGILTSPLIEPEYISSITPLGNLSPPGHTSPVDHSYFSTYYKEKIPLYAPADSWITQITEISLKNSSGDYIPKGYVVQYTVCKGLVLDFANYTELSESLTKELKETESNDCERDIEKPGHGYIEGQCHYRVSIPIKSGDLVGYTIVNEEGILPFEIWAANYNVPARSDVNWDYYQDNRYAHSLCTFDLYSGEMKDAYYKKFGFSDNKIKDSFVPRTVQPLCGQVNQNIANTIQGMWFGEEPKKDGGSIEFDGKGLAFVHDNIDPTTANLSIGGTLMSPGVIQFKPKHTGIIDREFSEVKADGNIYCYNSPGTWRQKDIGKLLVQLVNNEMVKVEYQKGVCDSSEKFITPVAYQR